MARRKLHHYRVLLTGASSGLGRALALELAARQVRCVLVARREKELTEVAEQMRTAGAAHAVPLAGDITAGDFRIAAIDACRAELGGIDLLINNAGVSAHGRFVDNNPATLRRILEVNFFAAAELTRQAIPLLAEGVAPLVVNVGSILGHRGIPLNSEYSASKFALRGWSEAVRPELAQRGIDLLLASPGTIDTPLFDRLIERNAQLPWRAAKGISPQAAAGQIIRAAERGRREVFPNWRGRLLVVLNRFAPGMLDRVMCRWG